MRDGKMERYSSINMSGCRNGKRSLPGTELAKRWVGERANTVFGSMTDG